VSLFIAGMCFALTMDAIVAGHAALAVVNVVLCIGNLWFGVRPAA
jgi:hypothetical protein